MALRPRRGEASGEGWRELPGTSSSPRHHRHSLLELDGGGGGEGPGVGLDQGPDQGHSDVGNHGEL